MHADQAGQTVVIVALSFTMLLGFAGLAIDGGRYYAERRFLQSAVDAAALGCVQKLVAGGPTPQADGEAQAKTILRTYNLPGDPTGTGVVVSESPQYNTWFNTIVGDKRNLYDGVYAGTTDCRVAVQASMQTLFIRLFGIHTISVPANAHAAAKGGMLPIIVNRYKDPPGPSATFIDYTKKETHQNTYPNTCSENGGGGCPDAIAGVYSVDPLTGVVTCSVCDWGPETVIAGQGYQSSDSDFRGFIALDIRDFSSGANFYYNGVSGTTSPNSLKDREASYVNGGYPGPDLEAYVPDSNPVQPMLQLAAMSGNSAGVVVSNFAKYFRNGDRILVQLFDGQVREVPDFSINAPSSIAATPDGVARAGPSFRVGANQRFRDDLNTVALQMLADTFDVTNSDTPSGVAEFHFNPGSEPNPPWQGRFTPAGGSGTQVGIPDVLVPNTVPAGIYSVVIKSTGYKPDGTLTASAPKQAWVPLNVGGVNRDFQLTFSETLVVVETVGNPGVFTFTVKTGSAAQAWGTSAPATQVAVTVDRGACAVGALYPVGGGVPVCMGSATISPTTVMPDKSNPPTVTITIPTTGVAPGTYRLMVRVRGINQDGQPVVHVQPLTLAVGTTPGIADKYVNVQGYSVFVITSVTANTVSGRAVSGYYADPKDPALNVAHKAGLIPWEAAPCGLPTCP